MEKDNQKYLMEVKGCTLERNGIGYFPDVKEVLANIETHLEFGTALEDAKSAGVKVLFFQCDVGEDSLKIK